MMKSHVKACLGLLLDRRSSIGAAREHRTEHGSTAASCGIARQLRVRQRLPKQLSWMSHRPDSTRRWAHGGAIAVSAMPSTERVKS